MKKFFQIAFLLLSAASFAQGKFIEVEVTDTITLKPLTFRCNVYMNDDTAVTVMVEGEEDVAYDPVAEEEKAKNRLQEIKKMLETKKYKVGPLDESNANIFSRKYYGTSQEGWSVVVNSEAEVQKVKDLFKSKEYVAVDASVLKYADEVKAEELLIKKIIDKAKARAAVIGMNSGMKPGRIIEVKEGKHSDTDGMSGLGEFYMQMARMKMMEQGNSDYRGSLSKTFVVKFAAE